MLNFQSKYILLIKKKIKKNQLKKNPAYRTNSSISYE